MQSGGEDKKESVSDMFHHRKNFWERCLYLSLRVTEQVHLRWTNGLILSWQKELGKWCCSKQHIICGNQRECAASRGDWIKKHTAFLHSHQRVDLIFRFSIQSFSLSLDFDSLSLSCLITCSGNPFFENDLTL